NARYDTRPQKARIVVELPPVAQNGKQESASAAQPSPGPAPRKTAPEMVGAQDQIIASDKARAEMRTKRLRERQEIERTAFDNMRAVVNSEWLRRVFIVFLIASFIGLAVSTYHYCAGIRTQLGTVAGAPNLNMRSEPGGDVLAVLPLDTRVRVFEYRGRWARIKVLQWAGDPPENTPDAGWVDSRFIKIE
ncbi:MAG TPA: SH3 domain-containing protein, partial [Blastocatellia bacterium]|nr:SH3 domain-containing protein [Blastocatellia bacterium]